MTPFLFCDGGDAMFFSDPGTPQYNPWDPTWAGAQSMQRPGNGWTSSRPDGHVESRKQSASGEKNADPSLETLPNPYIKHINGLEKNFMMYSNKLLSLYFFQIKMFAWVTMGESCMSSAMDVEFLDLEDSRHHPLLSADREDNKIICHIFLFFHQGCIKMYNILPNSGLGSRSRSEPGVFGSL